MLHNNPTGSSAEVRTTGKKRLRAGPEIEAHHWQSGLEHVEVLVAIDLLQNKTKSSGSVTTFISSHVSLNEHKFHHTNL